MKAYEKASLSFGIVSIPVSFYKATAKTDLSLRSLHECGTPLKRPFVCPTCDENVSYNDMLKGYEVEKGTFVSFTANEVKEAKAVKSTGFETLKAVNFKRLAAKYVLDSPYYVLPSNEEEATLKGYALVKQTLADSLWALVGRLNTHKRSRNVALVASKSSPAIIAYTIREAREVPFVPEDGNPSEHEAELMNTLIKQSYSKDVTVEPVEDPVAEMVEAKVAGKDYAPAKKGDNLEELLQKSIEMAQ